MSARAIKRKLENGLAGYVIDARKANPALFVGLNIVAASTGRSPDDPQAGKIKPVEPDLPYLSISCQMAKQHPDFPAGYGIYHCTVSAYIRTHASEEGREVADLRIAQAADLFDDTDAIMAALNQPESASTPDTRREKDVYVYSIEDIEQADDHGAKIWEDSITANFLAQDCDPDRA